MMLYQRWVYRVCCGLILVLGVAAGCNWPAGYLPSVIQGELAFLGGRVPIEAGLDDPTLTDEQRQKLAFFIRARDYAEQVVGLNVDNNYREFVNLGGEPLAWNLSASRKDALEPYYWSFPIVGPLPYIGFFDLDQALTERDGLVEASFDTFVYEVDTYALWVLPDPVTSGLLTRDYGFLADVVMHELLHNTVYNWNDEVFSESLAVFVGRTAGLEFLQGEFGPDAPEIERTRLEYEDEDRFNAFLQGLIADLRVLYGSALSPSEKLAAREPIFQAARDRFAAEVLPLMHEQEGFSIYTDFPFNNAYLIVNVRYHSDQDVYAGIYEMAGRDWPAAMAIFAAAAGQPEPVQYLREQLAAK